MVNVTMGYTIQLKTEQQILVKSNATDNTVTKSVPIRNEDTFITFIFPNNVLTVTNLFFKIFFKKELENCSNEEEFNRKYVFKLTSDNSTRAEEIVKGIIHNYYLFKK